MQKNSFIIREVRCNKKTNQRYVSVGILANVGEIVLIKKLDIKDLDVKGESAASHVQIS